MTDRLPCPSCGGSRHKVASTRVTPTGEIRRRRVCECGTRFSTIETIVQEATDEDMVAKRVLETMKALGFTKRAYAKREKQVRVPAWVPEKYREIYELMARSDESGAARHVRALKRAEEDYL